MKPRVAKLTGSLSGRAAALLAVRDVFERRGQVQETLRALRADGRLAGREGALAMDTALGAVRHVVTIGHVLSAVAGVDPRRVSPALRALLWTAAYQIIWMDRIPLFAAVDQAVELAHAMLPRRAAGMVNAVLRRLSGTVAERSTAWQRLAPEQVRREWSRGCAFNRPVLPAAESEQHLPAHLAAATGERRTRFRALVDRFGLEPAEAVAWASSAKPVLVLQRNPLRIDAAGLAAAAAVQWGPGVEQSEDALFATSAAAVLDSPLFRQGLVYVQDQTAHRAARLLEPRPGERILDLCAAPGGKSITLACEMGDRGEIVACDSSAERLRQVQENIERLGLRSIRAHLLATDDANEAPFEHRFDAALVDVPCSNSGVIARRPEARLGLTPGRIAALVRVQADLLRRAAAAVRPGGRLVYSTCSIEPEENGRVVAVFLAERSDWSLAHEETTLPNWGPRPGNWRDGGYAALLRRRP